VAIVAKPDTALPVLEAVTVWREPSEPHHPLVGIVHALTCADGRPVLVCAADMPFLASELLAALAGMDPAGAPAVVASSVERGLQPLLGCYQPEAQALLAAAAREGRAASCPARRDPPGREPAWWGSFREAGASCNGYSGLTAGR